MDSGRLSWDKLFSLTRSGRWRQDPVSALCQKRFTCVTSSCVVCHRVLFGSNESMLNALIEMLIVSDLDALWCAVHIAVLFRGNRNASNSAGNREKRHSMVDINQLKKQAINPLPTLYKPKNFYRLDVRDLPKVRQ